MLKTCIKIDLVAILNKYNNPVADVYSTLSVFPYKVGTGTTLGCFFSYKVVPVTI